MDVLIFPSYDKYSELVDSEKFSGPIYRIFKAMEKKYPRIHSLVNTTLKELEEGKITLDQLTALEKFETLKDSSLWELRIPPKGTSGVFRGYCKRNGDTLILYAAEIKKNFKKAVNRRVIKDAENRYKEHANIC